MEELGYPTEKYIKVFSIGLVPNRDGGLHQISDPRVRPQAPELRVE